jgi:hypothetical protein
MSRLLPIRVPGAPEVLLGLARSRGERLACFLDETRSWFGAVAVEFDPYTLRFRAHVASAIKPENQVVLGTRGTKVRVRFPVDDRIVYFLGHVVSLDGASLELRLDLPFFEQQRRTHPRFPGHPGQYFTFGDLILSVHDISVGGLSTIAKPEDFAEILKHERERGEIVSLAGHELKAGLRVANLANGRIGFRFTRVPYAIERWLLKLKKLG